MKGISDRQNTTGFGQTYTVQEAFCFYQISL